jgi:hypothetical protein
LKSLFRQHWKMMVRVQLVQQVRQLEGELVRQRALLQLVQVCLLQLVQ